MRIENVKKVHLMLHVLTTKKWGVQENFGGDGYLSP